MRTTTTSDWPEVNAHVGVHVREDAPPLATRVEDLDGGRLVVAAPLSRLGVATAAVRGVTVELSWTTLHGTATRSAVIDEVRSGNLPLWVLRGAGGVRWAQRRSYVRVPVAAPLILTVDGRRVHATVVDLSEGGMRCTVRGRASMAIGDLVDTSLRVEEGEVPVMARAVRVIPAGSDLLEIGLQFVDITVANADRIRRTVFATQVRSRAMGLA